jgi:hypothetical protein
MLPRSRWYQPLRLQALARAVPLQIDERDLDRRCLHPNGSRSVYCGRRSSPISDRPCNNPAMRADDSGSSAAKGRITPMHRIRSRCCAFVASGQLAAVPPIIFMKSRRRIAVPARTPRCSAVDFHHQNRKLPAAKRGSMPNVHCRNPQWSMSQMGRERLSSVRA